MSSISSIQSYGTSNVSTTTAASSKQTSKASGSYDEPAAVYEKSSGSTAKNTSVDHAAIVKQLQADADARSQQLMEIVKKSLGKQASTFNASQGLASVFSNLTVSEDVRAQAARDIAEDGYWGVEQTSDRILDFAKALSGGDSSKAQELLDAFKKGFQKATKAWGTDLPEICQNTYAAVEEKFQNWMNGTEE